MEDADRDDGWETLARLIRHPLRQHVLFKYTEGETSPRAIAMALGARLNVVSYHTQVLLRAGVLELVRTEPRRGATEHFYRATLGSVIEDAGWAKVPVGLRRVLVRRMLEATIEEVADAVPRGGMDDPTVHMSRSYFRLDREARSELSTVLRETFARAHQIARASGQNDAVPYELVIFSFERGSSP
jgi:DNA-binding transcriptional ArsR family regulator